MAHNFRFREDSPRMVLSMNSITKDLAIYIILLTAGSFQGSCSFDQDCRHWHQVPKLFSMLAQQSHSSFSP